MGRTCERCGGKASPFIPRTRLEDGRLVCAGCAQAASRERTAGAREGSDHWDGELADDRYHPLLQPLPESVWDRYHESRKTAAAEPGAVNPHHAEMHPGGPGEHEWYHGTGTSFEGPPKSATELMSDHGYWGNFGAGDWNNHIGSHWTSLHGMSKAFMSGSSTGNRVIHAKLHMKNPVQYNSLDHMTHDAYERLHASGHMQDDGKYVGNHRDDASDEHACCSGRLLEYAKGQHRSDGKYGLEAYRDSLRASGHDGIVVRNNTDDPIGHHNAIPLSSDQIEITHGGCNRQHHDERDNDDEEFETHRDKLVGGWKEEAPYSSKLYSGDRSLPDSSSVHEAHVAKKALQMPHLGPGEGRGDADPEAPEHDLDDSHEENEPSFGGDYCSHCDELTDHSTEMHGKEHDLRHLEEHHGFGPDHFLHDVLKEMSPEEVAAHHHHEHTTDFPSGEFPTHFHHNLKEARMAPYQKVAHDSGDGATIFHCPFCGSGQVIARSDRSTECEYCHTCFTVQVQPQFPAFPQTIDGMPMQMPGMPGQVGGPPAAPDAMGDPMGGADPMGGGGFPPGEDGGEEDEGFPGSEDEEEESDDEGGDSAPPFAKGSMLRTASGAALGMDNYLKHLAIKFADDKDTVIERVREGR